MKRYYRDRPFVSCISFVLLLCIIPNLLVQFNGEQITVKANFIPKKNDFLEYRFSRYVNGEIIDYQISTRLAYPPDKLPVTCSKIAPSICEADLTRSRALLIGMPLFVLFINGILWSLPLMLRRWTNKPS